MKINYAVYSRQNGWNDWAEIFCGHSCEARNLKGKKSKFFILFFSFSTGNTGPFSQFSINMLFCKYKEYNLGYACCLGNTWYAV